MKDRIAEICTEIGMVLEDCSADILLAAHLEYDEILTRLAKLEEKIQVVSGQMAEIHEIISRA